MNSKIWDFMSGLDFENYSDMSTQIAWYLKQVNIEDSDLIAIYGAGKFGHALLYYLRMFNPETYHKITCVMDKYQTGSVNGLPVISPKKAIEDFTFNKILVTVERFNEEIVSGLKPMLDHSVSIIPFPGNRRIERIYFDQIEDLLLVPNELTSHINRYLFAAPYCIGKSVLDMACGVGYGSNLLSKRAENVVGIDIDPETVEYAKLHFLNDRTTFLTGDCTSLKLPMKFDRIVSFETLEHILPDSTEAYFNVIAEKLNDKGIFIVSIPYSDQDGQSRFNEFHTNEMTIGVFKELVRKHFSDVDYYYQEMKGHGAVLPEYCVNIAHYQPYELSVIAVCYR